ncbi:pseudouridine synthase [uncultured Sphaerochaeta sp.]|uniref:pseudouridine synthase n=1 Tax=uncultured Sphaerochaeta sp. TaxID=886478 RepID=UPI002A0A38B0|nr:pseudouridine synthase [uncultured Sphaerochaeta sp.]
MEKDFTLSVVHEDPAFLVVDKQALLPTVPLKDDDPGKLTLLSLVSRQYPEVLEAYGQNTWEGGVLHRLDTATSGLVVIARTQQAYQELKHVQKSDLFWKEYIALSSAHRDTPLPGFPQFPYSDPYACGGKEVTIGSLFRRYGENRKEVRPVTLDSSKQLRDKTSGAWYLTKVCFSGKTENGANQFTCRLSSGFRHQVRVHLAWSGWPLDGDLVYQGKEAANLGLRAVAVRFLHPTTQEQIEIRIQ